MRLIDRPKPSIVVVGTHTGGLYALWSSAWELYRSEYETVDVEITDIGRRHHTVVIESVAALPVWNGELKDEPIPWDAVARGTRHEVMLHAYAVDGVVCRYGFLEDPATFFVQER